MNQIKNKEKEKEQKNQGDSFYLQKIRELKILFDEGALDEDEFKLKKNEILNLNKRVLKWFHYSRVSNTRHRFRPHLYEPG